MSREVLLNIRDINLDPENPRHDLIKEQILIRKYLIRKDKVKQLARHIAEKGINPMEIPGVIKNYEGNYTMVEGNRRLCALALLNAPEKSPSEEDKLYFKRLAKNSDMIPKQIKCILFESLSEAEHWISLRHEGEQNGIGTRQWNAKQKTRNKAKNNRQDKNALAHSLLEYASQQNFLPKQKEAKILTTATRYLGNPYFRTTIGITSKSSDPNVLVNVPCEEFNIALKYFCLDLVGNIKVHSRTNKIDRENYAKTLIELGLAPKSRVREHRLDDCFNTNATDKASTTQSPQQTSDSNASKIDSRSENSTLETYPPSNNTTNNISTKNPDTRKYIIPNDFKVKIQNKILRRVFEEIKKINIEETPLAVSLNTRAFLENLYALFHEKLNGNYIQEKTHIVLDKVIRLIEQDKFPLTQKQKNALGALKRVQSNKNNALSPKTLGAYAHGGIYPNPKELRIEFDNIAEIIKYMLEKI